MQGFYFKNTKKKIVDLKKQVRHMNFIPSHLYVISPIVWVPLVVRHYLVLPFVEYVYLKLLVQLLAVGVARYNHNWILSSNSWGLPFSFYDFILLFFFFFFNETQVMSANK